MSRRSKVLLLVVLIAALINLPYLHSTWTAGRVERDGVDVEATVTDTATLDAGDDPVFVLEFTLPEDVDPERRSWSAQVDEENFDDALETDRVGVRVLPDQPSAYRADGQVVSRVGLWITLLADVALLAMAALVARFGGRRRTELVLVATEDLQRCKPGTTLERGEHDRYVVEGEVVAIEGDHVVLDLGERQVRVLLDGHHNPVGYQQPARAIGRMTG